MDNLLSKQASKQASNEYFDRSNTSFLKGIAILLVMMCHLVGSIFQGSVRIFTPLGGIGVSIFLLLSGYGLNESFDKAGLEKWWRKRFLTILLPYIIVESGLYWTVHEWDALSFLLDIALVKPLYSNGWYLNYLLLWYVIFYIVMSVPHLKEHKVIVFSIISFALFLRFATSSPIRAEQSVSFLTGIILSDYKERECIRKVEDWKSGILLTIVGVFFLGMKQTALIRSSPQIIYSFIELLIKLPCGLGICFMTISVSKHMKLKVFGIIGAISYELYLIHGYVLEYIPKSPTGVIMFVMGSFGGAATLHFVVSYIQKYCKRAIRIT